MSTTEPTTTTTTDATHDDDTESIADNEFRYFAHSAMAISKRTDGTPRATVQYMVDSSLSECDNYSSGICEATKTTEEYRFFARRIGRVRLMGAEGLKAAFNRLAA